MPFPLTVVASAAPRTPRGPLAARAGHVGFDPMIETIAASRCPRCATIVAPPAPFCPHHPVAMTPVELPGVGEVISFTTLHVPPEGFKSPLHLAIVELEGGAHFVCHGSETRGVKIGSRVAIEAIDHIYYFAQLGALERARIFWRRAGRAGDRVNAIARSWAKRALKGPSRADQ